MKKFLGFVFMFSVLMAASQIVYASNSGKKVLIFTKTTGFRHDNIEKGVKVLKEIFAKEGISSFHTEDAEVFRSDSLNNFQAVIFFSTTGTILNKDQKESFERFIESGKGFMGIHAATDTEYEWPWYHNVIGAYFASHPAVQEAHLQVKNRKHPATKHLKDIWIHKDEWYDFKDVKPGLHVLMNLDEKTYKDGKMGEFHPIAWYQEFKTFRMFYTGLGHTKESFDEINFQKHLIGGLKYVMKLK